MVAIMKSDNGSVRQNLDNQTPVRKISDKISDPVILSASPVMTATIAAPVDNHTKTTAALPPTSSRVAKTFALRAFQAIDFIVLITASLYMFNSVSPLSLGMAPFAISAQFVLAPFLLAAGLMICAAYNFSHNEKLLSHLGKTICGLIVGVSFSTGLAIFAQLPLAEMSGLVIALSVSSLAILALHANYMALITSWTRSGALATNVVMVGATPNAQKLIEENTATGDLNVAGIFEDRAARAPKQVSGVPVIGNVDDLLRWEHLPNIDRIIITVTSTATTRVREMIDRLRSLPQDLVLFVDMGNFNPQQTSLAKIANAPMAFISGGQTNERRVFTKRLQDIVFASLMLVAFAPVMALVALAIRLDSKGPILFQQKRHGFNNKIINVFKFRSMRVQQPNTKLQQVTRNDERITKVGKFIRRTSLDELPQLINVLMGNMSLVGPRPHAIDMHTGDVQSRLLVSEYAHRHRVKPGLTGWAQINGSRGPLHNADDVRERVRLDVEYIAKANFWFDLLIMLKTAPCLLGDSENTR
ncbi:MAG: exopolysaccharide biosynthesis polyprenyl glycosylphosphotransferase [Phycisphaerales bacterium]|nr:exopolysaccharide biosynthesis polyprenyl glycosylphosphotransferase [Phycisphaerales bacterium]